VITEYPLKNSSALGLLKKMNASLKRKLVCILTTIIVLAIAMSATGQADPPPPPTSGEIDLFTTKEPYSGKGLNVRSDAFGPEEIAVLCAVVSYNSNPVENLLVAFNMRLPSNASFTLPGRTDATGFASVNFTISTPPINVSEGDVFGEWTAHASTLVAGIILQDTMGFRVDWVVKLTSVRTIDQSLTSQTYFGVGGEVGFEITLRSIAMVVKDMTLALVIEDEMNVPVNFSEIRNLKIQADEKPMHLYCKLYIPRWAYIGKATVFVSALTNPPDQAGVLWCPYVSAEFFIRGDRPLNMTFHDVAAVSIAPSARSIEKGQSMDIGAIVQNEGVEAESFYVNFYFGTNVLETLPVSLSPHSYVILDFSVNTSTFELGNYTLSLLIPELTNEADVTDNILVDGAVEVRQASPPVVHDIAIVGVQTSVDNVFIGELLYINVSVLNNGTETESFSVSVYCNSSFVGILNVNSLSPMVRTSLMFAWNTTFAREGYYTVRASAPVENDAKTEDNTFVDGIVEVRARPVPVYLHDIAVIEVVPSSRLVYVGEVLVVNVVLRNNGNVSESFDVQLLYESMDCGSLRVDNLSAGAQYVMIFNWDTSTVAEGNYTLSALAETVLGEVHVDDNFLSDGTVMVIKARTEPGDQGFFWSSLYVLLILLLILVPFLLLVWMYLKKRRKKSEETFYSGWSAWYYRYDLPRTTSKRSKHELKKSGNRRI
jgi:hypothetical protein